MDGLADGNVTEVTMDPTYFLRWDFIVLRVITYVIFFSDTKPIILG